MLSVRLNTKKSMIICCYLSKLYVATASMSLSKRFRFVPFDIKQGASIGMIPVRRDVA